MRTRHLASRYPLREVMELLLTLKTRDEEDDALRVVFPREQEAGVSALLDQYFGSNRSRSGRSQTLAVPGSTEDMLRLGRRLLTELQERNASQGFLTPDEQRSVSRTLARTSRPPRRLRIPIRLTPRRIAAAVAVAVVLALTPAGAHYLRYVVEGGPGPTVVNQPPPPANDPPLTRTDLQKTVNLFGPWQTIAPSQEHPDTNHPAILLLKQNGATLASQQWSVPLGQNGWERQASTDISKFSVEDTYVVIESATQQTYIVHVGQPFIFERTPGLVYAIDQAGQIWLVNLAQATAIRQPLHH